LGRSSRAFFRRVRCRTRLGSMGTPNVSSSFTAHRASTPNHFEYPRITHPAVASQPLSSRLPSRAFRFIRRRRGGSGFFFPIVESLNAQKVTSIWAWIQSRQFIRQRNLECLYLQLACWPTSPSFSFAFGFG